MLPEGPPQSEKIIRTPFTHLHPPLQIWSVPITLEIETKTLTGRKSGQLVLPTVGLAFGIPAMLEHSQKPLFFSVLSCHRACHMQFSPFIHSYFVQHISLPPDPFISFLWWWSTLFPTSSSSKLSSCWLCPLQLSVAALVIVPSLWPLSLVLLTSFNMFIFFLSCPEGSLLSQQRGLTDMPCSYNIHHGHNFSSISPSRLWIPWSRITNCVYHPEPLTRVCHVVVSILILN